MSRLKVSCKFLSMLYNMTYKRDGNQLFVYGAQSMFKVNLTDMNRFGVYTLYHKNNHRIDKAKTTWHPQLKSKDIYKVIFYAFSHDFYKNNNLWANEHDVAWFKKDVELLDKDGRIRNGILMTRGGFIDCPICHKKLSAKNPNGEIRYKIHCRCKSGNHHTTLEYKTGVGYVWTLYKHTGGLSK